MTGDKCGYLTDVNFDDKLPTSPFISAMRMHFKRGSMQFFWDLALEHNDVAVLLYHKSKECFVFVKQFRPAVFVQKIRQMPENTGKSLNMIEWSKYPISMGETLELCAGIMDKSGKTPLETICEEIVEECGYNVDPIKVETIKTFLSDVGTSGSLQYLFFAEIDESMKENEGGGIITEGEIIEKVFMSVTEAKKLLDADTSAIDSPASFLYAISWFLRNKSIDTCS